MLALPIDANNDEFELFLELRSRLRNVYVAGMRMGGYSVSEIAEEMKMSKYAVRKILNKDWVKRLITNNVHLFVDPKEQAFYHGKFIRSE